MTTDEFNLAAAKDSGYDEIDEYVATKNADLKKDDNKVENGDEKIEVTLDEAVKAKLDEVVNTAKASINEATEEEAVSEVVSTAKLNINTLYELAKTKVEEGLKFESDKKENAGYGWQLARLTTLGTNHEVDEETFATLKAGLDEIANTARTAMAEAVTPTDYTKVLSDGKTALSSYIDLVKAKLEAKDALTEKATSIKNTNKEKYTDADNTRIDSALEEALKLLEAETVVDAAKVAEAQTAGEKIIEDAKLFNGSAAISRTQITEYVDKVKTEIVPNSETLKYVEVEGIKNVVDDELAKIDTRTTPDELVADRTVARKNIYEAVRAYMVQTLDELSKLTATKDTDELLSVDCYKNLVANKEKLTEVLTEEEKTSTYDTEEALKTLVEDFKTTMAKVDPATTVRQEMIIKLFNSDEDIAALLKNVVGSTGTYSSLSAIKTILDKAKNSINSVKSYAEYETAVNRAKTGLPTAVNTELGKLVDSVVKTPASVVAEVKRKINAASTVKEKIEAYEKVAAPIVKDTASDVTLGSSVTSLNGVITSKKENESKGLKSIKYDENTNTATFEVDTTQASQGKLYNFMNLKDNNDKGIIDMFKTFANGATKATYVVGDKTVNIDDLSDKMESQDLKTGVAGIAAKLLLDMAGKTYSDSDFAKTAIELTYEDMVKDTAKPATATFYFETENGVEYSVTYIIEFVKGAVD